MDLLEGIMTKQVKADFDHLKKLFILPDSQDKFIEYGNMLLDMLHKYFAEKGGLHSEISIADLGKMFSQEDIPRNPSLLKIIFPEIHEKIISHSVKVGSPYYIGHMTSPVPWFAVLVEMIIASLNQNQVKIETAKASTFVEREFIAWIHRLVFSKNSSYYKKNIQNHSVSLGAVTVDGTLANLTALFVARNKLFKPQGSFGGVSKEGIREAMNYYNCEKALIIVSQRGHYSIDKIASIIGIGEDSVIKIPVDSNNKMKIDSLINECRLINEYNSTHKKKIMVISIVGIGGTTETGNIDDLNAIRKCADSVGAHFHVDAAWGGPVLFVDSYRHLFSGIETADSVTFDCHKLLFSPNSMGMVLFKNERDLENIKRNSTYILRPDSVDLGRFTVEGSRPFTVLRPWSAMKVFGSEGFRLLFEYAFELTSIYRSMIETHINFELLNYPELFIINYRFIPEKIRERISELKLEGGDDAESRLFNLNLLINSLNIELHRSIRDADNSFVSRTVLESTKYSPQKISVLRAVTVNPLTDKTILKEILEEHNKLGVKLYNSTYESLIKKASEGKKIRTPLEGEFL